MAKTIDLSVLAERFLNSDLAVWVRKVDPILERAGCYGAELRVQEGDFDDIFVYEILVCKNMFEPDKPGAFTVNITCRTATTSTGFTVWHDKRSLALDGDTSDIARARWAGLDDPIINKIRDIARAAKMAAAAPATVN